MKTIKLMLSDEQTGYKRLYATIVDFLIISFIVLLIPYNKNPYILILKFIFIELAYFVSFETLTGYTIGKLIFQVKVIRQDFQKPSIVQSLIRALFWLIEANPMLVIIPVIVFYIIQNNKTGQRFGDRIAGTFVIKSKYTNNFIADDSNDLSILAQKVNKLLPDIYDEVKGYIYFFEYKTYKKIIGIENISYEELLEEVHNGKRFIVYPYFINFSFAFIFSGSSCIYFDKYCKKSLIAKIKYIVICLITLLLNLDFIRLFFYIPQNFNVALLIILVLSTLMTFPTISKLIINIKGGYDITDTMLVYIKKKMDSDKMII